ncbi:MAG TPA: hypothetical protein VF173_00455 [Thermoanaerobaculia bacterium]|nr:hypothetical protein [Thermoanaerobaculia bacterium]
MPWFVRFRRSIPYCALAALTLLGAGAAWSSQLELLSRVQPQSASDTGSAASGSPAASADGRYTAFVSGSANLAPGQIDDNRGEDVFLYDRITGAVALVSHAAVSPATAGNQASNHPEISADGRWVAFLSLASNLVANAPAAVANKAQVFLYDRIQRTVTLVSHSRRSARTPGHGGSSQTPAVSADGRYVAFSSDAADLAGAPSQDQGSPNVFLFDRTKGTLALVSRKAASTGSGIAAGGDSPAISADGRYVAFRSFAEDLVPGQGEVESFTADVFVFDRVLGTLLLASHANGSPALAAGGTDPVISADGGDVVFGSAAANLVAGQTGENDNNVFEFHRSTGIVTLLSHTSASLTATSSNSNHYAVSADGGWVAFSSQAADLVPGQVVWDPTGYDVFLWERATGAIRLVSHSLGAPKMEALGYSNLGGISADGKHVLFDTDARDVVIPQSDDTPPGNNVFLYDRTTDRSVLLSYAGPGGDLGGNGDSLVGALSADGNWAAFTSEATNLEPEKKDLNWFADLFLYGLPTGDRELVSRRDPNSPSASPNSGSSAGNLSADGRFAVFTSGAAALVPEAHDVNGNTDVYLYDRVLKKTTLVSHTASSPLEAANAGSGLPVISADGHYVVYLSEATNLVPGQVDEEPGGNAIADDVFLYDRLTGQTTLVSRAADSPVTATNQVEYADLSADGSTIAFVSEAPNLVAGAQTGHFQQNVYLYDRASGAMTLVSHADGFPTRAGDGDSFLEALSADGRLLLLGTVATDLLNGVQILTDDSPALYLYDRTTGKLTLVSHPAGSPNTALGAFSGRFSADGHFIAFESFFNGFVPGEIEPSGLATLDVYLYDRIAGTATLVSHAPGAPKTADGASEEPPAISGDGRFLAYAGGSSTLPPGSQHKNIRLFDRLSGQVQLISKGTRGEEASGDCSKPRLSTDGRYLAFASQATNLTFDPVTGAPPFGDVASNVYLYDQAAKKTTLVSRSIHSPRGGGNGGSAGDPPRTDSGELALSASGGFVLFDSIASNLVARDFNGEGMLDVFLYSPTP